jgi:hypothetical protein
MAIDCALLLLFLAHQGQVTRTLMLEPAGDELHVVVHVSVTGEARKRSLMILDAEARRALLIQRALDGVRLLAGTATVAVTNVEVKTKQEGPIELMLHGTARIRGGDVSVVTATDADPIDLVVLPGNRPVVRATRGAKSGGLKTRMGAGDRVEWLMLVDRASAH